MITIWRESNKRKNLLAALLLAVLLAGCGVTEPTETTQPTTAPEETTLPEDTLYVPGSAAEQATGGAVKEYQMEEGTITGMGLLGGRLLLSVEDTRLQLLTSDALEIRKERELSAPLNWQDSSLVVTGTGMAYYDGDRHTYVLLDENLAVTTQAVIGEELLCAPVVSRDFSTIYYATAEGIKAMDFNTGIARMLRQEHGTVQSLEGLLLESSLLHYTRTLENGTLEHCFVDVNNGSNRYTGPFAGDISGWDTTISGELELSHPMGSDNWILNGSNQGIRILDCAERWDGLLFPAEGMVILQRLKDSNLELSCCDLATGAITARVTIPRMENVFPYACANGDLIWLCGGVDGTFYGWDRAQTPVEGAQDALVGVTTLDHGDLTALEERAQALSGQYGVEVSFHQGENRTEGVDYSVYPEYRVEMYTAALDRVEEILQEVPGEFWTQLARKTKSGRLNIRLEDAFNPDVGLEKGTGAFDVAGDELTITVTICADMKAIFYHQLCHVMEVRINSTSTKLNTWNRLNPRKFSYTEDYDAYEAGEYVNSEYLDLGSNYFADDYGLVNGREDRAQIFMYATMEDQDARFSGEAIQKKLSRLCQIIRSVYKLEDDLELPWEQYLTEG